MAFFSGSRRLESACRAALVMALISVQAFPADTASHFAHYSGIGVHYKSYGEGSEAVVFIHGWTCDLTFWHGQAPVYLNHRSLLIDLPGHGESDKPHTAYPVEFFARSINAVMRDAGVDRAVLVGHSLGGPIVYTFLRMFPDRVKALVLVDANISAPEATLAYRKALAKRYAANARILGGRNGARNFASRIDSMFSDMTPPELRDQIRAKMLATPEYVRVAAVSSPSNLAPPKPGEAFDVPVLAIEASPGLDARNTGLRDIFPQVQIDKWEGHGHFLMLEDPSRFNRELENFLATQ